MGVKGKCFAIRKILLFKRKHDEKLYSVLPGTPRILTEIFRAYFFFLAHFSLSLSPAIYSWVSEDGFRVGGGVGLNGSKIKVSHFICCEKEIKDFSFFVEATEFQLGVTYTLLAH